MDAKQFLTEYKRMCDSFDENGEDPCGGCPLNEAGFKYGCDMMALANNAEEAVRLVEQWSQDHPVMTNAMVFEDMFGRMPTHTGYVYGDVIKGLPLAWWEQPYVGVAERDPE